MPFVVIDFEAERDLAGNYFPTEIGLCRPGFRPISSLISPKAVWRTDETAIFNIGLWHAAQTNGKSPEFISARVRALTAGADLVSDVAFFDRKLMARLDLDQELIEFFPLVERLAQEKGIAPSMINRWINEIDEQRTASHRAGEDAWVRAELLARVLKSATPVRAVKSN